MTIKSFIAGTLIATSIATTTEAKPESNFIPREDVVNAAPEDQDEKKHLDPKYVAAMEAKGYTLMSADDTQMKTTGRLTATWMNMQNYGTLLDVLHKNPGEALANFGDKDILSRTVTILNNMQPQLAVNLTAHEMMKGMGTTREAVNKNQYTKTVTAFEGMTNYSSVATHNIPVADALKEFDAATKDPAATAKATLAKYKELEKAAGKPSSSRVFSTNEMKDPEKAVPTNLPGAPKTPKM